MNRTFFYILGYQEPGTNEWRAKPLTRDHKPENVDEMQRIKRCGGKVVSKSGMLLMRCQLLMRCHVLCILWGMLKKREYKLCTCLLLK